MVNGGDDAEYDSCKVLELKGMCRARGLTATANCQQQNQGCALACLFVACCCARVARLSEVAGCRQESSYGDR
jgi:hypothetical protein